jgi:DNA-binding NarL/FixJ family response regulator
MMTATDVKRILLVDDHEIVRRGIASLLTAEPDLQIAGEADDVDSAVQAVQTVRPHLMLLDLSLKNGDGLDVLRRLRELNNEVPTLVLSMYDEAVYAERALRAGAKGYLRKVDVAQTIITAVRKVLAGQIYVSDAAAGRMLQKISSGKQASAAVPIDRLTDRELQVLRCIGRGMSNHEIADELIISTKTVESHREHLKSKLGLATSGDCCGTRSSSAGWRS